MNNVLEFQKEQSVAHHINLFLDSLESESTQKSYAKNIDTFLKWKFKDIPVGSLSPDNINQIQYIDMEKFKNHLKRKYSGSTTNNYLFSVYGLFNFLNKIQDNNGDHLYDLNVSKLKVKMSKLTDQEQYGDVSFEEVQSWIDYIKESDLPRKENKWIFLHMAVVTGLRKQALANMTFKDLRKNGDGIWQIRSTLKGKTKNISIREEDANLLLSLRVDENNPDEKILKLSTKSMERLFSYIRDEVFNIDPERHVTLHSLRYLSGWLAYKSSGNSVLALQSHLGHTNLETSYRYVQQRAEAKTQASLYINSEYNTEDVKDITQEQWLNIYEEMSKDMKYEVKNIIEKLGY